MDLHISAEHVFIACGYTDMRKSIDGLSAIVGHVHDELIIECRKNASVAAICEQMGRTPPWAKGLLLRADGYECDFYKKD